MLTNNEYIAELNVDANGYYNLFLTTFNGVINYTNLQFFFCNRRHEARLDLVSFDLYQDTQWTGTLCQINGMLNPFSVKDGDIIAYLPVTDNNNLMVVSEAVAIGGQAISQAKSDLINALKKKTPDKNRLTYLNNRPNKDLLPNTVLKSNAPSIVVENNKIKISPNLFTNPVSTQSPVVTATSSSPTLSDTSQEDNTTRILVRRYIKTIGQ